MWTEAKGSCIPARNEGQVPFVWWVRREARFFWALQNLPWMSCISRRMGARRGRYIDRMVSINSFMLPAVEIAWIVAVRVAALLPEIPAMAVPIAAGEAPRMGREEEEGVISRGVRRKWEKKRIFSRSLGLVGRP